MQRHKTSTWIEKHSNETCPSSVAHETSCNSHFHLYKINNDTNTIIKDQKKLSSLRELPCCFPPISALKSFKLAVSSC